MLCERCGKREAVTHLRMVVNGNAKELHLCGECAGELGYGNIFKTFSPFDIMGMDLNNFLGGLFTQSLPEQIATDGKRCSFCGSTFEDIAQSAKAGCANCYKEFYGELLPSIQRIHGKTRHVGKIPGKAGKEIALQRELSGLKRQLEQAVQAQEYEKAAALRDQIRELEKKEGER